MIAIQLNHFFLLSKPILSLCSTFLLLLASGLIHATPIQNLNNFSDNTQTDLGRAFTFHLHSQYDIIQDPEINHYIRSIGQKIVQHTDNTKNFRFYVINNPDINAFAGPDGVIGIHTGLIQSVTTEDELASVIAHEIGHVTQEHLYRRMVLQSESSLPQIASMIASILIGMQDPNAGMAALMGSTAYQIEKQLKYSRLHEYEADFVGINYLNLSGYDPHAMPDFFEKLANSYQHQGMSAPEILRTHPLTENRLAKAQARASSMGETKDKIDNTTLNLIQSRLENVYDLKRMTPFGNSLKKEVLCYQSGIETLNKSNVSPPCLTDLINSNNQQYLYHALNLEILASQKEKNTIIPLKPASFSYDLFPSNESITTRYSELLEKKGNYQQAIQVLEDYAERESYRYNIYNKLGRLNEERANTAKSYLFLALAQLEIGNLKRAAIFVDKAKNDPLPKNNLLKEKISNLEEKLTKLLRSREDE